MSDDMKKYWERRRQEAETQPHYKPAHELQNVDVSKLLNGYTTDGGNSDFDLSSRLVNRLQMRAAQQQMAPHHQGPGSAEVVDLREGFPYFISINDSFGTSTPIVRKAGVIGGPTSKSVQIRKEIRGYLVESHASVVDIAKIQGTQELVTLVEVSVPFVGTFLVNKEAILYRNAGAFGNGRTLLKG